ncbi:hypothetical protein AgCh_016686 [Apium graveolens]
MKPIRTRVVKKRVKQRDPLIPRVFLPIPEKSFELTDQADGIVEGYKAKLLAKGFSQTEGLDYFEALA